MTTRHSIMYGKRHFYFFGATAAVCGILLLQTLPRLPCKLRTRGLAPFVPKKRMRNLFGTRHSISAAVIIPLGYKPLSRVLFTRVLAYVQGKARAGEMI